MFINYIVIYILNKDDKSFSLYKIKPFQWKWTKEQSNPKHIF